MANLNSINALLGKVVYLDTNIFIYAVEQPSNVADIAPFICELFAVIDSGEIKAVTSELTLAEILVGAYNQFPDLIKIYEELITDGDLLQVRSIDRAVLQQSALLRSVSKIALADAIHVATAIMSHADVIITNDKKMQVPANIEKLILSDIINQ